MDPTLIVLGEAEHLYYYPRWNTVPQNRSGDIAFDCRDGRVDVYVSSSTSTADFLDAAGASAILCRYIGSLRD